MNCAGFFDQTTKQSLFGRRLGTNVLEKISNSMSRFFVRLLEAELEIATCHFILFDEPGATILERRDDVRNYKALLTSLSGLAICWEAVTYNLNETFVTHVPCKCLASSAQDVDVIGSVVLGKLMSVSGIIHLSEGWTVFMSISVARICFIRSSCIQQKTA